MKTAVNTFIFIVTMFAVVPSFAGSCRWVFGEFEFSYHIRRGDAESAAALLAAEKTKVAEEMANLSEKEKQVLGYHWAGRLTGDAISTPIDRLMEIARALPFNQGGLLVDIGSGHSDPGFVFTAMHPHLRVHGFEIALPKVAGTRRMVRKLGLYNVHVSHQDVFHPDFQLPVADYYYLFNPARIDVVERMADQIQEIAKTNEVKVIVVGTGWTPKIFADRGFVPTQANIEGTKIFTYQPVGRVARSPLQQLVYDFNQAREAEKQLYDELMRDTDSRDLKDLETEIKAYAKFEEAKAALYRPIIQAIRDTPGSERVAFLRGLTNEQFNRIHNILDHLLGIQFAEANAQIEAKISLNGKVNPGKQSEHYGQESIWFFKNDIGPQSDYSSLLRVLREINPQPGQWIADLGSGFGRMGMLIGLFYPEVRFTGLELVGERVDVANAAAKANGFTNVEYHQQNLADRATPLPSADYFYMFNPTNGPTSNIITQKLVDLAATKDFQVVLLTSLDSHAFYQKFHEVPGKNRFYQIAPAKIQSTPAAE